jgi:fluoride exporter
VRGPPSCIRVTVHLLLLTSYVLELGMLLYVALGSALGGVSRYLVGGFIQRMWDTTFPTGTLIVNLTGSLLIGLIIRYAIDTPTFSPEVRTFLTIGFCGGYTTFSTFSYETITLLQAGEWGRAGLYLGASVLLSLVGTLLGMSLGREIILLRERL